MNGKPKAAWDVYLSMESSADSFNILEIIGNDCYQMGQFFYALKAFEALEKVDNDKEYDDALRGAVIGVFQMVVANKEPADHLIEALAILKSVPNNPQDEYVFKVIKKWAKDNRFDLDELGLWLTSLTNSDIIGIQAILSFEFLEGLAFKKLESWDLIFLLSYNRIGHSPPQFCCADRMVFDWHHEVDMWTDPTDEAWRVSIPSDCSRSEYWSAVKSQRFDLFLKLSFTVIIPPKSCSWFCEAWISCVWISPDCRQHCYVINTICLALFGEINRYLCIHFVKFVFAQFASLTGSQCHNSTCFPLKIQLLIHFLQIANLNCNGRVDGLDVRERSSRN